MKSCTMLGAMPCVLTTAPRSKQPVVSETRGGNQVTNPEVKLQQAALADVPTPRPQTSIPTTLPVAATTRVFIVAATADTVMIVTNVGVAKRSPPRQQLPATGPQYEPL